MRRLSSSRFQTANNQGLRRLFQDSLSSKRSLIAS